MKDMLLLLCVLLLTACVSSVKSVKTDVDVEIDEESGYLLIGVAANRQLNFIQMSGADSVRLTSSDLRPGSQYLLVKVKAGRYAIEKVQLNSYYHLRLDDGSWDIEVHAQKVSYIGTLELNSRGYWSNVELVNRSSEALEFMERRYPSILEGRQMVFGGVGNDAFFELIGHELGKE